MGEIRLREGDAAGARTYLERATKDDPQLAAAHYRLGLLYAREDEDAKSLRERQAAEKLNEEAKRASKTQLKLVLPESAGGSSSSFSSIQ